MKTIETLKHGAASSRAQVPRPTQHTYGKFEIVRFWSNTHLARLGRLHSSLPWLVEDQRQLAEVVPTSIPHHFFAVNIGNALALQQHVEPKTI